MGQEQQVQEQNNSQQSEIVEQQPANVTWYIQSGTVQGTSEQPDSVEGLIVGFLELVKKTPWAALGELVYGSKRGFDSENPYLIPVMLIAASIRQQENASQTAQQPSIKNVMGVH